MLKRILISLIFVAATLLAACQPLPYPGSEGSQPTSSPTWTLPAPSSTPPADTPTDVPTQTAVPTSTPLPPTQTPTQAPTRTPTPTATPIPCNQGYFIGNVSIPDGTVLSPETTFQKIWRLQNIGGCSWTTAYSLVFVSGDLMEGPTVVPLSRNVNPGDTVDLSVTLTAPSTGGTYQGSWMLRSANGVLFGLGSNADKPFWARIQVGNPTPAPFAVTHVVVSADPTSFTGKCPATFSLIAQIWTNGAGKVTYYWLHSDGTQSEPATINFSGGGYQIVSTPWTFGVSGAGYNRWARIYIDQPNHQFFDQVEITLSCVDQNPQ